MLNAQALENRTRGQTQRPVGETFELLGRKARDLSDITDPPSLVDAVAHLDEGLGKASMGTVHVSVEIHGQHREANRPASIVDEPRLGREVPAELAVHANDEF